MAANEDSRFRGMEFYRAVADKLLDYLDDRTSLIEGIHKLATTEPLLSYLKNDRLADGTEGPLRDICPFTVIGAFNRGTTDANRRTIAGALAELLGVEVPVPEAFRASPSLTTGIHGFSGLPATAARTTSRTCGDASRQPYGSPAPMRRNTGRNLWGRIAPLPA